MIRKSKIAMVGIGNTIAGDDGVGVLVVARLRERWNATEEVLVAILPGDLFAVSDLLGRADRFLFVDAIAGDRPGEIQILTSALRAFAPSLHQTDIGTVMTALKQLEMADPFPAWQVWGITIERPEELGEGLSPEIAAAAERLEAKIIEHVEALLVG
ncbi:MAG: hydrogenase maturation protease [Candidatus Aminicenantes bacterium]|nr:MAG: hydrogenase maturation protease [Candidatus Aminicenantes bacterium]